MDKFINKPSVRMMMLIVSRDDAKKASLLLEAKKVPIKFLFNGEGTASSEILDYLGLAATEKAILLCPVLKFQVPELFEALNTDLKLKKPNRGVAFTFPISGVSAYIMKLFNEDIQKRFAEHLEGSDNEVSCELNYSMLMVILNQGYSEDAMAVAREAGAGGGTIVRAHRIDSEETMKRWGIHIQPEKEIIFILSTQDKKAAIMKAVGEKCGLLSEAKGIVVAIPVEDVAGLAKPI